MIWILLIVFQFKHFIADYPLQTPYMLGKFKEKGWIIPLVAHCFVHFLFTFAISSICTGNVSTSVSLGVLDFTIHFVMDRIKASPKLLGRFQALSKQDFIVINNGYNPVDGDGHYVEDRLTEERKQELLKSNRYFWYSLGLDQMVHHLTDILIIYLMVSL